MDGSARGWPRGALVRWSVTLLLAAGLLAAPAAPPSDVPARAQEPLPRYTIEAITVFFDPFEQAIKYTLRGHRFGDDGDWVWWKLADNGEADTAEPVGPVSGWSPPFPEPYPDAALTRGGLGLVVWEDALTEGLDTCFIDTPTGLEPTQETPRGMVHFAALDGRALPQGTAAWVSEGVAAEGDAFTMYLSPSVALDSTGRGLLIWRELEFIVSPEGCWSFLEAHTRIRYRMWDGDEWVGSAAGDVVPGSVEPFSPNAAIIHHAGYTDVGFTSEVTPGAPTRQQAIAVWDEVTGIDSQVCAGDPEPFTLHIPEVWPQYAVWDGENFAEAESIPVPAGMVGKPDAADGPPFRANPFFQHSKIGIAGDRGGEADLVFGSRRVDSLCEPGPPGFEVWTARWNDETQAWEDPFKLADGDGADVAQDRDDTTFATYGHVPLGGPGDSVRTRTESAVAPGTWSEEVQLAEVGNIARTAVAAAPHFGRFAVWHEPGGALFWAQKARPAPGGTETLWSAGAALEGAESAMNVEMAAPTVADWGFLVYGGGDNNLEQFLAGDLEQMEQVGSGPALSIVVQVDDATGAAEGSYRTHAIHHPGPGLGSADAPDRIPIGEPDMGDPATLDGFLDWAEEQYVADKYALVMWDHGDGWKGIVQDEDDDMGSGGDWLSMDELSTALDERRKAQERALDLIAFDACLMAQLEVARQVYDHAWTMVASQDCIPGSGFPYDTILADLEANPGWNHVQLGRAIVDRYPAEHPGDPDLTISAIRLNQDLLDLANAVGNLAGALELAMQKDDLNDHLDPADNLQMAIRRARTATTETTVGCCKGGVPTDDSVDLLDLLQEVNGQGDIAAGLKTKIPIIQQELTNVCIRERHGSDYGADGPGCGDALGGLSIYFPEVQTGTTASALSAFDDGSVRGFLYAANPDPADPADHPAAPEPNLLFVTEQPWDSFLYTYYMPMADAGPDFHVLLGDIAILDASGSSDSDGTIASYTWDLDPDVDGPVADSDTDRDGIDETDDDADVTGSSADFPCIEPGAFRVMLTVRDNHEQTHTLPAHHNADSHEALVFCEEPEPPSDHERSITMRLRRHLRARGVVTALDGEAACEAGVPVKVQRKAASGWRTVKRGTTAADGTYSLRLRDRPGRYRARAPLVDLGGGEECLAAVSPVRRHRHG